MDVIVTSGTLATRGVKEVTSTIPIVMASVGDAVAAGLVRSLAQPGGNAFDAFTREPNGGLLVLPDVTTVTHRRVTISLAARHRLPAIYPTGYFVSEGGLMAYGVDYLELYRQAAAYVDRILRGSKPSELPVQEPRKFELVVNLKTARTLGLTIPQSILVGADRVIE